MSKHQPANQHHSEYALDTATVYSSTLRKTASERTHDHKPFALFKKSKSKKQEAIDRLQYDLERVNSDKEIMTERSNRTEQELRDLKQTMSGYIQCFNGANTQVEGVNDTMKETLKSFKLALTMNSLLQIPDIIFGDDGDDGDKQESDADDAKEKLTAQLKIAAKLALDLNVHSTELIEKTFGEPEKQSGDDKEQQTEQDVDVRQTSSDTPLTSDVQADMAVLVEPRKVHSDITFGEQSEEKKREDLLQRVDVMEQQLQCVKGERDGLVRELYVATNFIDLLTQEINGYKKEIGALTSWNNRAKKAIDLVLNNIKRRQRSWL